AARELDRQRDWRRLVRDQYRTGEWGRRIPHDRAARRAAHLRQGGAGPRRTEPDQRHPRVRAHQLAAAADQFRAGRGDAVLLVPADAGQWRRSVLFLQLLTLTADGGSW